MDLSIIIPSFNTKELLRQCLESLNLGHKTGNLELEVIVVDNGSTDDSFQMVVRKFPQVKLVRNKENLGFAKAVNRGIRVAKGKFLLVLNSDIVVTGGSLGKFLANAKKLPFLGVAGGRLLNPDKTVQGSCFYLPTVWRTVLGYWLGNKKYIEKFSPLGEKPQEVEAIVGAVFFLPRSTVQKVGLFDEKYFMYFEDLDYCRRVQKAGLKVYYLPKTKFIHYHGASGKKIPNLTSDWLKESSKKYHGWLKYWVITLLIALSQLWQPKKEF